MRRTALLAGLFTGLGALAAVAAEPAPVRVPVRASEQGGLSRLVFDLPSGLAANPVLEGDHVMLLFSRPVELEPPAWTPRSVRGLVSVGINGLVVQLAPGTRARVSQTPEQLVMDVLDPPLAGRMAARRPSPPSEVEPLLPTLAREPQAPPLSAPAPQARTEKSDTRINATAIGQGRDEGGFSGGRNAVAPPKPAPAATAVEMAPAASGASSPSAPPAPREIASIQLPFPAHVGAAAFLRGGRLIVVFDKPEKFDLPANTPFAKGAVDLLPAATVLRLPLPPNGFPVLTRDRAGWRLGLEPIATPLQPAEADRQTGSLLLRVGRPGRTVAIPDPASGAVLLIGTETEPADRVERGWETPEFGVLPTLLGVAVEPYSDRVQLQAEREGFRVGAEVGGLALSAGDLKGAAGQAVTGLSRDMPIPNLPLDTLRSRLLAERVAAAAAPPLARGRPRLTLARTMLALGMAQDALGVLGVAATTDPRLAADPELAFLQGAAELLAFRPEKADGLSDRRLPAGDDVALWRALRDAESGTVSPATLSVLAKTAPILLDYPEPIRQALLPLAAETLIGGGRRDAAAALLSALPQAPELAMARALDAEAAGDTKNALSGYDALTNGADRLARIKAALRAVNLRVARGMLTPAAGADALDRLEDAWRGDGIERARRERAAELRAQAHQWRTALADLREAAARFPAEADRLAAKRQSVLASGLRQDAARTMRPGDFLAMLSENQDVLAAAVAAPNAGKRLAEQLLDLDLPPGTVPLLSHLVALTPAGEPRAMVGARVAEMRLASGDDAGAKAALADSAAEGLPAPLAGHRAILAARIRADSGDVRGALQTLSSLGTDEADGLRADLAERSGDFPAAVEALRALLARRLPAGSGKLDEASEQLALRLASDSAHAGDASGLDQLRGDLEPRLTPGPTADIIRLLLAQPVRQLADLPRAAKETSLAGTVADRLAAKGNQGGGTPP